MQNLKIKMQNDNVKFKNLGSWVPYFDLCILNFDLDDRREEDA